MRHFLTLRDYEADEILEIIDIALKIKTDMRNSKQNTQMSGKTLAMIFEKSSTRTRVSFESGIYQLGGHGLFLSSRDIHLGSGEPIKDTARVISGMCDMIMIRTFAHSTIEEFAKYSEVSVINGLTDSFHPVQLLADYMTLVEHNHTDDLCVAYVGDGNNIINSWMMLCAKLGFKLRISTPKGYEPDSKIVAQALQIASKSGAKIEFFDNPQEAVKGSSVVTTDTWTSMGQESEKQERIRAFSGYIVDEKLMSLAQKDALFLHCLPAYRGLEVSDEVLESASSVVFDEAQNRLHAQKGLMVWLDSQI